MCACVSSLKNNTMEEAGSSTQLQYRISFYINKQIWNLETDNSQYQKLTENDEYAVQYIQELINSNFIKLDEGPLTTIKRILDNGNEYEIFPATQIEFNNLQQFNDAEPAIPVNKSEWTIAETKFVLDKYEQYLPHIGPMKKFKTKKRMWQKISADLQNILGIIKTDVQCENRYKTVLKRKTKAQGHNRTTGETRENIDYDDELKKIAAIDDSVAPEQLRGVGICIVKEPLITQNDNQMRSNASSSTSQESEETPMKKCKNINKRCPQEKKGLGQSLLDIQKEKELSRERRHQEKMKLISELVNALKENH